MCLKFVNKYFVSISCFPLSELHMTHEEGAPNTTRGGATQAPALV